MHKHIHTYTHVHTQKFWVLETVARIPDFACISILHLYESVGFWRAGAELRKIHFFEEWNELHHLQVQCYACVCVCVNVHVFV